VNLGVQIQYFIAAQMILFVFRNKLKTDPQTTVGSDAARQRSISCHRELSNAMVTDRDE
jgi:hypothetical protein